MFGMGNMIMGSGASAPPPTMVTRNAVNFSGPGNNANNSRTTSNGSTANLTLNPVNRSGAPITTISMVFSGWWLTTAGTSATGNDYPVTARVEYPAGTVIATMLLGGNSTIIVPNGSDVVTDEINIAATPIPNNATFRVVLSTTTPNGQFYTTQNLGLTGILTKALSSTLRKEMLFAIGDSIMTNNGGVIGNAANVSTGCPSMQMSIGGTTAQTYATGANFSRQVALAKKLGATRFVCNFSTNDFGSGRTLAQVQADLTTLKNAALAEGIAWTQATTLPRVTTRTVTASLATGAGNTITLTVPDASLFTVGLFYTIAGSSTGGYNGTRVCIGVNLGANTVDFLTVGAAATPAVGTITIVSYANSTSTKLQWAVSWEANRIAFNTWIRSGGLSSSYIEWADSCEPSRGSGKWATGAESPRLRNPGNIGTVTSLITTARFNSSGAGIVGNGGTAGVLIWMTGPNIATSSSTTGTNGGDISISAAPTSPVAIGHTFRLFAIDSYGSDDGTHPKQDVNGVGGQAMIAFPTATWLASLLT